MLLFLLFCSVLAQIFLYDTSVAQLKFNPRRKDLVAHFFAIIPEVDQLSVSDASHDTFKSSKTGTYYKS